MTGILCPPFRSHPKSPFRGCGVRPQSPIIRNSSCHEPPFYFILDLIVIKHIKEVLYDIGTIACPVGDKVKMLIRQIRSFGSFCKELVCMSPSWGKPKASFKAPTYTLGGSNFSLHGRVGLFSLRLAIMTLIPFWRIIHREFVIENRRGNIFTIESSSPPKVLPQP